MGNFAGVPSPQRWIRSQARKVEMTLYVAHLFNCRIERAPKCFKR